MRLPIPAHQLTFPEACGNQLSTLNPTGSLLPTCPPPNPVRAEEEFSVAAGYLPQWALLLPLILHCYWPHHPCQSMYRSPPQTDLNNLVSTRESLLPSAERPPPILPGQSPSETVPDSVQATITGTSPALYSDP